MRKRWIAGPLVLACLPVAAAFTSSGQLAYRGARAWLSSKADFTQCTADPRIWCEPGAEALGAVIAPKLPAAVSRNEQVFGMPYSAAIRVNVYASDDSFSRYSVAGPHAAGVVTFSEVHIAGKMKDFEPARAGAILTHEMAHLHLIQRIGTAANARLPNWFMEGLPTYLSNGGGAGKVTREEAVAAFVHGPHFTPEDAGSLLAPKQADSYKLSFGMYYRQASVLVGWMDSKDPAAFKRLLEAVGKGEAFGVATARAYGRPLDALWAEFQQAMRQELINKPSGSA